MGDLIRRQDAIKALVECDDIRGVAYVQLERALKEIPAVAVERDCNGCFGASFGDCPDCEEVMAKEHISGDKHNETLSTDCSWDRPDEEV